jgi:hypothetical protein
MGDFSFTIPLLLNHIRFLHFLSLVIFCLYIPRRMNDAIATERCSHICRFHAPSGINHGDASLQGLWRLDRRVGCCVCGPSCHCWSFSCYRATFLVTTQSFLSPHRVSCHRAASLPPSICYRQQVSCYCRLESMTSHYLAQLFLLDLVSKVGKVGLIFVVIGGDDR